MILTDSGPFLIANQANFWNTLVSGHFHPKAQIIIHDFERYLTIYDPKLKMLNIRLKQYWAIFDQKGWTITHDFAEYGHVLIRVDYANFWNKLYFCHFGPKSVDYNP